MNDKQIPARFLEVIAEQEKIFDNNKFSIQVYSKIPDTADIPINNPNHWLKIPNVICVFVDMKGSTQLSAENHDKSTASAYQLFTSTAVRLFHEFDCPYIDVRGDGVFALFNEDQICRALASAVTFKTFAREVFVPKIKKRTEANVGSHLGIDQKTVLVKKLGLKRHGGRSDRQNEVWAGKPVNMASKLASLAEDNELIVSDRFFSRLKDDLVLKSCGCPGGKKTDLWTEKDTSSDPKFDFDKAYSLKSNWCSTHGAEFCERILELEADN